MLTIAVDNDTTALATSQLNIGNNIAVGTVGNTAGAIALFADTQYVSYIVSRSLTADRVMYMPDKAGTFIVSSDNPMKYITVPVSNRNISALNITVSNLQHFVGTLIGAANTPGGSRTVIRLDITVNPNMDVYAGIWVDGDFTKKAGSYSNGVIVIPIDNLFSWFTTGYLEYPMSYSNITDISWTTSA